MIYGKEIVKHIFDKKTIAKVKQQFIDREIIKNIDNNEGTFRLLLTGANCINFEQSIMIAMETTSEQIKLPNHGVGEIEKTRFYFKPLAIFTSNNSVIIPKEFENAYDDLEKQKFIDSTLKVEKFSVLENAVIGAFSIEMLRYANLRKDVANVRLNALDFDVFLTWDNEPQVWLDDKYGIEHPIGIFYPNGSDTINSLKQTKEIFERFYEMELLTAVKKIIPDNYFPVWDCSQ